MPILTVTRLRLRSIRFLPEFLLRSQAIFKQTRSPQGNLGVKLRKTKGLAFWTLTAWDSPQAMVQFVREPLHFRAIPMLDHWCDQAATVTWSNPTEVWPSWNQAAARLGNAGQLYELTRPSPEHASGQLITN